MGNIVVEVGRETGVVFIVEFTIDDKESIDLAELNSCIELLCTDSRLSITRWNSLFLLVIPSDTPPVVKASKSLSVPKPDEDGDFVNPDKGPEGLTPLVWAETCPC